MQSWSHQWCDLDVTGLTKAFILDIRTSKAEFSYILPVVSTRDVAAAGSPQVAQSPLDCIGWAHGFQHSVYCGFYW